jgi:hypothetical protein
MLRWKMSRTVGSLSVIALLITVTAFTPEVEDPYCFKCFDYWNMSQECRDSADKYTAYTYHEDDHEEDWVQGNVYGTPHGPVNCVGNGWGNICGQLPGAHGSECLEGQEDMEAFRVAFAKRDFHALAALVSKEAGHVRLNSARGSLQTTSCSKEYIIANVPLSPTDLALLRIAITTRESKGAVKTR